MSERASTKGRLSATQWKALAEIDKYERPRIRFPTGEVLRKAGLVSRETDILVGRDYADKNGVWVQWRGEPKPYHSWYLTPAGRAALATATPNPLSEGRERS